MNSIQCFETDLEAIIGAPTEVRPFVCDGSPLDCKVFIVGFNPATSMQMEFWQFWRSGYGFDKKAWFNAYKEERKQRPLKPGKTRRNILSNSRRVIEWILEEASPVTCLETNIYAAPTECAVDLGSEKRITAPFDFLMERIQPQLIVVHGDDAANHIRNRSFFRHLIFVPHFSRGWSQEKARSLGREIRSKCSNV